MIYKIIIVILILFILINNLTTIDNFYSKSIKIDKYYIINLDKDVERLNKFDVHAKKNNLNYTRFPAIDGKKINKNDIRLKKYFSKNLKNYNLIRKSCALSHITLWQRIKEEKNKFTIIFEDDVIIPNNFNNKLKLYLEQLPDNWDILFLGGNQIIGKKYSENLVIPDKSKFGNFGLFAYLINSKNINYIVDKCKNISLHIDNFVQKELGKRLNLFFCNPQLIEVHIGRK